MSGRFLGLAWLFVGACMVMPLPAAAQDSPERHRLLVLTDIEADPDDTQSLVRLLLYANEIDIEGLVATTSTHLRSAVHPESIRTVIAAYEKVRPNLLLHDKDYPAAASLQALVKQGVPEYGMAGVGEGKDTEGSEWLIRALDDPDPRPLWVNAWGGANTLAQALFKLRATRPAEEVARLVSKLRVYTMSDQDDAGPWIRANFPELFYIVTPGSDYGASTWGGIMAVVDGIDDATISNAWLAEHIQQGHGPLGAAYPDVAWGMEGDTPAFLGLIPNGLNVPERPDFGGWGGRYELYRPIVPVDDPKTFIQGVPIPQETRPIWTNSADKYTPSVEGEFNRATRPGEKSFESAQATLWRWRDDFQHDFAARMDWTVEPFAGANHPPVPRLEHAERLTVKSGQGIALGARPTTDPDGDSLSFYWFNYPEAGGWKEPVPIEGAQNAVGAWVIAPKVDKTETLHFILRVRDKGTPPLTRYKRVIVTVER